MRWQKEDVATRAHLVRSVDLQDAREHLVWSGRLTAVEAIEAERLFRQFLEIIGRDGQNVAAFSPLIDEFWHATILFTRTYSRLCKTCFGRILHHQPATRSFPIPAEAAQNFLDGYRRHFGEVPDSVYWGLTPDQRRSLESEPLTGPAPMQWSGWVDLGDAEDC